MRYRWAVHPAVLLASQPAVDWVLPAIVEVLILRIANHLLEVFGEDELVREALVRPRLLKGFVPIQEVVQVFLLRHVPPLQESLLQQHIHDVVCDCD